MSVDLALVVKVNVVCAQPELPSGYLQWTDLKNVEFLVEGGASIIYTADYQHNRVIAKVGEARSPFSHHTLLAYLLSAVKLPAHGYFWLLSWRRWH